MPVANHPIHPHGVRDAEHRYVPGYEQDYVVSESGEIFSMKNGAPRRMRQYLAKHGYFRVNLCINGKCKLHYVHEIVAAAFLGQRPSGLQVRHLNSNSTDNRVVNLEYGTRSENEMDKVPAGLSNRGSRHGMSILEEDDVRSIKRMLAEKMQATKIAKAFGVNKNTIYHIKKGTTWSHLDASS